MPRETAGNATDRSATQPRRGEAPCLGPETSAAAQPRSCPSGDAEPVGLPPPAGTRHCPSRSRRLCLSAGRPGRARRRRRDTASPAPPAGAMSGAPRGRGRRGPRTGRAFRCLAARAGGGDGDAPGSRGGKSGGRARAGQESARARARQPITALPQPRESAAPKPRESSAPRPAPRLKGAWPRRGAGRVRPLGGALREGRAAAGTPERGGDTEGQGQGQSPRSRDTRDATSTARPWSDAGREAPRGRSAPSRHAGAARSPSPRSSWGQASSRARLGPDTADGLLGKGAEACAACSGGAAPCPGQHCGAKCPHGGGERPAGPCRVCFNGPPCARRGLASPGPA
ncbi:skin secretory protein xP2-like [Molothrus ater]|uniref:skin secretory protein xP2-like n=1 Tax=Molothrus ater TaxID=84834 RepID=UPI0017488090|nr:skin secretory protein xP2-like [Molothrus ater]